MVSAMSEPRTVLVTGGNRGIGLATARRFADAGHRVVVTSRSGQPIEGLSVVKCDVTDSETIDVAVGEIEEALGKPVTSSNHALAWHSLRLAGIDDTVPSQGKLFRESGV